jgi:hypothetical protein
MSRLVSLCLLTAGAALTLTACSSFDREGVRGSGVVVTRDYDIDDFDRIRVGRALEVSIQPGDGHRIELTADDNIVSYITVDRRGDTLVLDVDDDVSLRRATHRFEITMPTLERLELHGAATAQISDFAFGDAVELDLSGASELDGEGLQADALELGLSGASEIRLAGVGERATIHASGASFVELRELTVAEAEVELHGASKANIMATDRLEADLSGVSKLRYGGVPSLGRVETSGGSGLAPA